MSAGKTKKEQLQMALTTLAMDIALNDQVRFDPSNGPEEIVRLLKYASTSSSNEVQQTFAKVGAICNPGHRRFFEEKGISFSNTAAKISIPDADATENSTAGKRKIVYRGQVKWV